jgi:hypothetical protein
MRVSVTCAAVAVAMLGAGHAQVPLPVTVDYVALVHQYMTGNPDEAVARAARLNRPSLFEAFKAFVSTTPSAGELIASAAMHTEAGVRSTADVFPATNRHLEIAAAIVEIGTPLRLRPLGSMDLRKTALPAVPQPFRRLWYLTVIRNEENGGRMDDAQEYLGNARTLFPRDAEFLQLSGIAAEMRASGRLHPISEGDRRRALGQAESYLRGSLQVAPDGLETRLRLGRVLSQRDQADEARSLLTIVSEASDVRLSYLASLFLGGLEDSAGNLTAAAQWYARAAARMPDAQTALIAGSELRYRAGERREAAVSLASGVGPDRLDPWWAYLFGEYWKIDIHLKALRGMGRS